MRKKMLWIGALAMLVGTLLYAQDIAGDWQGTLKAGAAEFRVILNFAKGDGGGWKAILFSIDQGAEGIPANSMTLAGSNLKLTVEALHGAYEGKVSADGASIQGTWTQSKPLPLEFKRATKETAWPRDISPHSLQFITQSSTSSLMLLSTAGPGAR